MSKLKVKGILSYISFFLLIISFYKVKGADYYISSSGDDHHSQLQATNPSTPWKSIDKINSINFYLGDKILFKRGDVFRGQINIKTNGLSFGAYGKGKEPVISGAILIKHWKKYKGEIYFANVDQYVKNIFVNGQQMVLARYPNKGFMYTGKGSGKTGFTDNHLKQKPGYWVGANVRVNVCAWINDTRLITEFTNSYIGTNSPFDFNISSDRSYYIDNKLSELDTDNEWFYDTTSHFLYLYAAHGYNPNKLVVEGVIYNYGFKGSQNSGVSIGDLQIEKQGIDGIAFQGKNNSIMNNKIFDERQRGINVSGDAIKIGDNLVERAAAQGIDINGCINSKISGNIVRNIGLVVAYGGIGYNDGIGIVANSTAATNDLIDYNEIDSTGYCGILFDGSNSIIEKNIIRYSLLTLADGGGIYMWGKAAHDNIIRNNFISYPIGFFNGIPGGFAVGIYLDDFVNHTKVIHNTVIKSNNSGIFFHDGNYNIARENVVYSSANVQFYIADGAIDSVSSCHNEVFNNIFYGSNKESVGMYIFPKYMNYTGNIDSNYYGNLFSDNVLKVNGNNFSLKKWQSFSGFEKNSKLISQNKIESNNTSQIFPNPTDNEVVVNLKNVSYNDLDGKTVSGSITIPPWSSKILIANQ